MLSLKSTKEELLALMPGYLENVKVLITLNSDKDLGAIFYQKKKYDKNRDWYGLVQHLKNPKPNKSYKDFVDEIYLSNDKYIKSGFISENDKILLDFNITNENDKDNIVHLCNVRRNLDPELKGLGKNFYNRLRYLVIDKDFDYISCIPVNDDVENKVWKNCGFKELKTFDPSFLPYKKSNSQRELYLIHKL